MFTKSKIIQYVSFITVYFLFHSENIAHAQYIYSTNKYYNENIENQLNDYENFHSSKKPFTIEFYINDTNNIVIYPVLSSLIGISSHNKIITNNIDGLLIRGNPLKKISFQLAILTNVQLFPVSYKTKIDTNQIMPFWGKYWFRKKNLYVQPLLLGSITIMPIKYLSLQMGTGSQFIGNGYRSLLLSDNAPPTPFLSLTSNFWKLEYTIRWSYLKDIDNTNKIGNTVNKFGVFHYFDLKLNNRLNIGFFESIIWWGEDSVTKRGVDISYLNPIIFFRPIEYAQHSPDNANLGANMSFRFWNQNFLYGQIFIDDLRVNDLLAGNNWWGNKYGWQIGVKSFRLLNITNLFFQTEFNWIRPYTYSHASSSLNYGSMYHSLAHPLGANFREILAVSRYAPKNWFILGKYSIAQLGIDTLPNKSVGQNIYLPYTLRITDNMGNALFMQGLKQIITYSELKIGRQMSAKWKCFIYFSLQHFNFYGNNHPVKETIYNLGISTNFINDERDY